MNIIMRHINQLNKSIPVKSEVPTADYRDYCVLRCDLYSLLDMFQCSEEPDASIFMEKEKKTYNAGSSDTWLLSTSKDNKLFVSPSFFNLINLRYKVKGMIDRLTETGRCYGMEMNVEKTKVMRISRQLSPVQIRTDQKQLENVEYVNYSGLHDNLFHQQMRLKFKEETSKVVQFEHGFVWC